MDYHQLRTLSARQTKEVPLTSIDIYVPGKIGSKVAHRKVKLYANIFKLFNLTNYFCFNYIIKLFVVKKEK